MNRISSPLPILPILLLAGWGCPEPAFSADRPEVPVYPVVRWSFQADGSLFGEPVPADDGSVLIASAGGTLYALDAQGAVRWTFCSGEGFFSSPAVGPDGRIFIGDIAGTYSCLSPQGSLLWQVRLDGTGDRRIVAPAAVDAQGRSFVVAWDNQVRAFDGLGRLLWTGEAAGLPSAPIVLDSHGFLYLAALAPQDPTHLLLQRMAPGWLQVFWRRLHPLWLDRNRITAAPLLDESRDRLYAVASRDSDGILVSIPARAGGTVREYQFPKGIVATPALGPAGQLYVPCLDGQLYALDPETGATLWVFRSAAPYLAASPVVDATGGILLGDTDGTVYALDFRGRRRWSMTLGGSVWSRPTPADLDETVYVNSADGRLYALGDGDAFVFPHFGDGASGRIRLQTRFELVNLQQDAEAVLDFFDAGGNPLAVPLDGSAAASRHRRMLVRGQVWTAETTGHGGLQSGWVRVTGGPGIRGAAVFRYSESGQVLSEAGIVAAARLEEFCVPAQRRGPLSGTGIALVNPGEEEAVLELEFRSTAGSNEVVMQSRRLPGGHQAALYVWELFPELSARSHIDGTVRVKSSRPLAAAALRQNYNPRLAFPAGVPTLTTFPVVPVGAQPAETGETLLFPHIARGLGGPLEIQTEHILVNASATDSLAGELALFTPDGSPDVVEMESLGAGSNFPFQLNPLGQRTLRTSHPGPLQLGYGRIAADAPMSGLAVLQGTIGDTLVYEAGVPAVAAYQDFTILVTDTGWTGLALVNVGNAPAQGRIRLYDHRFELRGDFRLEHLPGGLPAGHHFARFIQELFPGFPAVQGLATVESSQPLAAVTLVQHGTPHQFPDDVYRLAVYPVLPGRPD